MRRKLFAFGGTGGKKGKKDEDAKKVDQVPEGYTEDTDYVDPDNPNRKYYKRTGQVQVQQPAPQPRVVTPVRRPVAIGNNVPSKKRVFAPKAGGESFLDRVFTEPQQQPTVPVQQVAPVPTPQEAFMGDIVFDGNKRAVGRLRNRSRALDTGSGTVNTGYEDADFMYTQPDVKGAPVDSARGMYRLNTQDIQNIFGTTKTMGTDVATYKKGKPTMAMGGTAGDKTPKTKKVISGNEMGSVNDTPENLIQYKHPNSTTSSSHEAFDNTFAFLKGLDPTGISNYPDLYNAMQNGDIGDIGMEALASLPMVGKLGKGIKWFEKMAQAGSRTKLPLLRAARIGSSLGSTGKDIKFAMGGTVIDPDTLSEDELAQLEQEANEQGMNLEDYIQQMNENQDQEPADDEPESTQESSQEDEQDEEDEGNNPRSLNSLLSEQEYGLGGKVPIEAEGGEVMETPNGTVKKIVGPSHEQGGVDMNVPHGTNIYSDRLSVDGNTMQERKMKREKQVAKLEKIVNEGGNNLARNSLQRTQEVHELEEQKDMAMQEAAKAIYGNPNEHAYGGSTTGNPFMWPTPNQDFDLPYGQFDLSPVGTGRNTATGNYTGSGPVNKMSFNPSMPDQAAEVPENPNPLRTGDYIGMAGNIFNAIAPIINTKNAASNTLPVMNRFRGYGKTALDTNSAAMSYANTTKNEAETDLDSSSNAIYSRNRNGASSVNTLRALDTATDMGKNKAKAQLEGNFANQMMSLLSQRGVISSRNDQMEMQGQTRADEANAANLDNYYSNNAANLTNFGNNVQGLGRSLNEHQENSDDMDLLGLLSEHGIKIGMKNGKRVLINS